MPTKQYYEAIADVIISSLTKIVKAWKMLELPSYKIYFKQRKYKQWSLECPEFEDTNMETLYSEMQEHKDSPQWLGLSTAYWLASIMYHDLPKEWKVYVIKEVHYRELPVTFLSQTNGVLDFWEDVII